MNRIGIFISFITDAIYICGLRVIDDWSTIVVGNETERKNLLKFAFGMALLT